MSVFPLLHGGDIFRGLQMGDKNGFLDNLSSLVCVVNKIRLCVAQPR